MTAPEKLWLLWREGGHVKGRVVASEMDHSDEGFPKYTRADLFDAHIGAVLAEAADRATARWAAWREHADRRVEMDYPEALIDVKIVSAKADEAGMIAAYIRNLRPTAITALERAKREARVEGMRAAADACGQDNGPWLCSAWQCRETILRMIKTERGEAVTLPYDYSRCGITPANEACPLAARCARRTDPGRPTYQTYTAYPGGEDCYGFIEAERGNP